MYWRIQCIQTLKRHSRSGFGRAPAPSYDSWVQTFSCFLRAFIEVSCMSWLLTKFSSPGFCGRVPCRVLFSIQPVKRFSFSLGHVVPTRRCCTTQANNYLCLYDCVETKIRKVESGQHRSKYSAVHVPPFPTGVSRDSPSRSKEDLKQDTLPGRNTSSFSDLLSM
jgi:hypothetical protein